MNSPPTGNLEVKDRIVARIQAAIVSWNFRHIVHWEKIPLYNGINKAKGYHEIMIHTPQEVTEYEDEDV